MSDTIVLGYDGSPSAKAALGETVSLAKAIGARVLVVFGYYVTPLGGQGGGDVGAELEKLGGEATDAALAELKAAGVEAEARLVAHRPAEAILQAAEESGARLVAVGTVGENPITGALLGSVVLKLVQISKFPLLVVPAADA
jgi:nucleotide-binding universal stress UspA family protein